MTTWNERFEQIKQRRILVLHGKETHENGLKANQVMINIIHDHPNILLGGIIKKASQEYNYKMEYCTSKWRLARLAELGYVKADKFRKPYTYEVNMVNNPYFPLIKKGLSNDKFILQQQRETIGECRVIPAKSSRTIRTQRRIDAEALIIDMLEARGTSGATVTDVQNMLLNGEGFSFSYQTTYAMLEEMLQQNKLYAQCVRPKIYYLNKVMDASLPQAAESEIEEKPVYFKRDDFPSYKEEPSNKFDIDKILNKATRGYLPDELKAELKNIGRFGLPLDCIKVLEIYKNSNRPLNFNEVIILYYSLHKQILKRQKLCALSVVLEQAGMAHVLRKLGRGVYEYVQHEDD